MLIQSAFAIVSANIPLQHPVYNHIEKLSTCVSLPNDIHSIRPITEHQLYRLVKEAKEQMQKNHQTCEALQLIEDFLSNRGFFEEYYTDYFGYTELTTGIWGTNSHSVLVPEVQARINPLLENQQGQWQSGGITGWIRPHVNVRWSKWGSVDIQPLIPIQWNLEPNHSLEPDFTLASLKLGYGGFEIELGRFPVQWGHALSGSLILGKNHAPLMGAKIQNAFPWTLPWIFKNLGPMQFSLIVAQLDEQQHFPHSYMLAQRMGIKPQPWLEFGFTQTITLGGENNKNMSTLETIGEIFGQRMGDTWTVNVSNRNFLFDGQIKIPQWNQTKIYGELFLEDCCQIDTRFSNLAGIELPSLLNQRLQCNIEWVRTSDITYRNGIFISGFENQNHLLGHMIGPDAYGLYLFVRYQLKNHLQLFTNLRYERRGRTEKSQHGHDIRLTYPQFQAPEDRIGFTIGETWNVNRKIFLRAQTGYEFVQHYDYLKNTNKHHGLGAAEVGIFF